MSLLAGVNSLSKEDYLKACKLRLKIESQEPPVLHYLNLQCHNEIVEATHEYSKENKQEL